MARQLESTCSLLRRDSDEALLLRTVKTLDHLGGDTVPTSDTSGLARGALGLSRSDPPKTQPEVNTP